MSVVEVREELHAVVSAAALLPCVCRRGVTCIPCRARTLLTEIVARGIRIRRWRNDSANIPRHVTHLAGVVDVQREPRRSCPRYIVGRTQACTHCGELLADGKWALFFTPGTTVTKLRLRDGSQDFAQPQRPGDDSISCAQLARIRTPRRKSRKSYCASMTCGMICIMDQIGQGGESSERRDSGRPPYGWRRAKGVVHVVPDQHAIRSSIMLLRRQGLSYQRIAAILNAAGYPTREGSTWENMTVQRIVVTPFPQWLRDYLETAPAVIELVVPASQIENGGNRDEMNNNPFESAVA